MNALAFSTTRLPPQSRDFSGLIGGFAIPASAREPIVRNSPDGDLYDQFGGSLGLVFREAIGVLINRLAR